MIKRFVTATIVAAAILAPALTLAQSADFWRKRRSVPEFDPAAVGSMAVLLAGGATYVANRRRNKK